LKGFPHKWRQHPEIITLKNFLLSLKYCTDTAPASTRFSSEHCSRKQDKPDACSLCKLAKLEGTYRFCTGAGFTSQQKLK
jgi:hypothetical protein